MTKTRILAVLGGLLLCACMAGCPPNPGPGPQPTATGGTGPVPAGGTGGWENPWVGGQAGAAGAPVETGGTAPQTLEQRACAAANTKCAVNMDDCLKQVSQLRKATYAHLTDADLQCWVDAKDRSALVKCRNGVCR